jgi:hypothetical protein
MFENYWLQDENSQEAIMTFLSFFLFETRSHYVLGYITHDSPASDS